MRQHCAIISRFYANHSESASHVTSRHICWPLNKNNLSGKFTCILTFSVKCSPWTEKKAKNEETHSETVLCLVCILKLSLELCRFLSYYAGGVLLTTNTEAGEPILNETPYDKESSQLTWSLKLTFSVPLQSVDKGEHV